MGKRYPESKVEISCFIARHYDILMNILSLGMYPSMIYNAVRLMGINLDDKILDLGAGTGRNACLMAEYLSGGGEIIGLDVSNEVMSQFRKRCADFSNVRVVSARIDEKLSYKEYFDKVFISFVLHGFPQEVRSVIVRNAFGALKKNGSFFILDYNEFSFDKAPCYIKAPFKFIECPYAFDFIERDWEKILFSEGFGEFRKYLFFDGYVRLLKGVKLR